MTVRQARAALPEETASTEGSEPRNPATEPGAAKTAARAANAASVWVLAFIALHVYWFLGGQVGFGDQPNPKPPGPASVRDWIVVVVEGGMFAAGLAVPIALTRRWGRALPRQLLVAMMWAGAVMLLARGVLGLVDDALRFSGLLDGGLTGLSTKDVLGSAHPTLYTKLSTASIDSIFFVGGVIFAYAARLAGSRRSHWRWASLLTLVIDPLAIAVTAVAGGTVLAACHQPRIGVWLACGGLALGALLRVVRRWSRGPADRRARSPRSQPRIGASDRARGAEKDTTSATTLE